MSKVEQQLSSILPPREINKDGQLFIQRVASEPASRKTIIEKSELLDKLLTQAQVSALFYYDVIVSDNDPYKHHLTKSLMTHLTGHK